jgi:uncharacterized membrane protein
MEDYMSYNEAYKLLEISQTANSTQIKQAYKKQAKKYHPDLYQGDKKFAEEKMKQINEAYELLCKPHTSPISTSNNPKTSYDYYSEQAKQDAQKRAEAKRKYEEQKIREEAEKIFKQYEEYLNQRELAAKKILKLLKPILVVLFFILEFYLIKLLVLAINYIPLSFSEANWFFFAFWLLLGILAVILNIGVPVSLIWLFKKAKIFERKK